MSEVDQQGTELFNSIFQDVEVLESHCLVLVNVGKGHVSDISGNMDDHRIRNVILLDNTLANIKVLDNRRRTSAVLDAFFNNSALGAAKTFLALVFKEGSLCLFASRSGNTARCGATRFLGFVSANGAASTSLAFVLEGCLVPLLTVGLNRASKSRAILASSVSANFATLANKTLIDKGQLLGILAIGRDRWALRNRALGHLSATRARIASQVTNGIGRCFNLEAASWKRSAVGRLGTFLANWATRAKTSLP